MAGGLQAEPVLDGHEVEQAEFGLLDQVRPVAGLEQLARACPRLAPRGRMPASAFERDGQVHCGGCCGHDLQTLVMPMSSILGNLDRYCRVYFAAAGGHHAAWKQP